MTTATPFGKPEDNAKKDLKTGTPDPKAPKAPLPKAPEHGKPETHSKPNADKPGIKPR